MISKRGKNNTPTGMAWHADVLFARYILHPLRTCAETVFKKLHQSQTLEHFQRRRSRGRNTWRNVCVGVYHRCSIYISFRNFYRFPVRRSGSSTKWEIALDVPLRGEGRGGGGAPNESLGRGVPQKRCHKCRLFICSLLTLLKASAPEHTLFKTLNSKIVYPV